MNAERQLIITERIPVLSREEEKRAISRKHRLIYKQRHPERVIQSNRRSYERKRALKIEKGEFKLYTREDRIAQAKKILANETEEQRAARLKRIHSHTARENHRAIQLAKGPENISARFWSIISPNGVSYRFRNLKAFIRENRHLFTDKELLLINKDGRTRIYASLSRLSPRRKHCGENTIIGWRWNVDGETPSSLLSSTEGTGSAGSLAATERHLADMRTIAFAKLGTPPAP